MNNITVTIEEQDERLSRVRIYVNGLAPMQVGGKVKYQRLRLNAGSIPTKDWDQRIGRPSMAFSKRDGGVLHRSIDMMSLNAQRAYMEAPKKTAEAVRRRYDELLGRETLVERKSTLLADIVAGWRKRDDRNSHTIHTYTVFQRKVEAYERKTRTVLDLERMTTEDLEAFLRWVQKSYGLAPNTMASTQKFVNMALNELRGSGVHVSKAVKLYGFQTPRKDVLEWAELARIIAYEPKSRTEANGQTLLTALCLSGARISDTWLLLGSITRRNNVLSAEYVCTKNADRHPVTVSPIVFEAVRAVIAKNGMPPHCSEKHIRTMVKDIVRAAGVEKAIEVHSLRRSFVSLLLSLTVVPDHLLARCFTGHVMTSSSTRGMFHSYDHSTMASAHRAVIQALRMVPARRTAGVKLLSRAVCPMN